jgi:hypothetical protein
VTERDWADAHLVKAALDIHADDPCAECLTAKCRFCTSRTARCPVPASNETDARSDRPRMTAYVVRLRFSGEMLP